MESSIVGKRRRFSVAIPELPEQGREAVQLRELQLRGPPADDAERRPRGELR